MGTFRTIYSVLLFATKYTLLCDLESLLASGGDSLEHLMRTHVRFEVTRVPELAEELTKTLNCTCVYGVGGMVCI